MSNPRGVTSDRFKWLEFEDDGASAKGRAPASRRAPDQGKDEYWHVAEAQREFDSGAYEPALREYSAALRYRRDMEEAWSGQVRCMVLIGQMQQAVTWGRKGLDLLPTSTAMASALSYVLAHAEHGEAAMNLSDQLFSQGSEHFSGMPWLWFDRGVCLLSMGQEESAVKCFENALRAGDGTADWLQRIGQEYLLAKSPTRALSVFSKALEQRADRAFLWQLTGRAAEQLHLTDRAAEAFEHARRLDPTSATAARDSTRIHRQRAARPCWIATLVFASEEHPTVDRLRRWRDETWLRNPIGRLAARLYDLTAPAACAVLKHFRAMHAPLRRVLSRLADHIATDASQRPVHKIDAPQRPTLKREDVPN